jgi:hypothetical protein
MSTYLHVTVILKPEHVEAFPKHMAEAIPHFERIGWRLMVAGGSVTGRLRTVTHIWKIPSADSVLTLVKELGGIEAIQKMVSCIQDEWMEILSSMPYLREE